MKTFHSVNDTVKRTKRQATGWENIYKAHKAPDKGLVSRIFKVPLKLNNMETTQFLNWAKNVDTEVTRFIQVRYTDGK